MCGTDPEVFNEGGAVNQGWDRDHSPAGPGDQDRKLRALLLTEVRGRAQSCHESVQMSQPRKAHRSGGREKALNYGVKSVFLRIDS